MIDEAIELKEMIPEDEKSLLAFFKDHLKEYERFSRYWKWRKAPLSFSMEEKAVIAVVDQRKTVGCVGLVPADIRLPGKKIKSMWQQDSMVSPEVRGRGIGKKLVVKGRESCALSLAKGTSNAMYGLRKALGYQDVPHSNYLIRVCRPTAIPGSLLKRVMTHALGLWSDFIPFPKTGKVDSIHRITEFDSSFDDLAASLMDSRTLRHWKGKDYLNWRYMRCPGKEYTVYKAGREKACGSIVVNCVGADSDEGWIVDMICGPKDKRTAYALIKAALDYFNEKKVSRIWVFSTLPCCRKWFMRYGFLPTGRTPRFTYLASDPVVQKLITSCQWDFWHGDGDIELYQ